VVGFFVGACSRKRALGTQCFVTLSKSTFCALSTLWFLSCGGASEVQPERGAGDNGDELTSNQRTAAKPDPADADNPVVPSAFTASVAAPPPTPEVIALPVMPPPPATPPVPLTGTDDAPLVGRPVAPESWLFESEATEGGSDAGATSGDAGFASELRVDDLTILVIFDNSGSMDAYWDGGTRWAAANRSLVTAIEPVQTSITVGAIRFPLETSCGVPEFDSPLQFDFALGEDFLEEWVERALAPEGGTPLAQAFLAADVAIAEAGELGYLDERFRVVVLTDGEPNCEGDSSLLVELPSKWHERGVETVVLGLPGSEEAATLLDAIATAGGTNAHQSLGTVSELDHSVTAASR
jgi:hypothetical protein